MIFWSFCLLSRQHSDQISEGSQVSKVTLCVQILSLELVMTHILHRKKLDEVGAEYLTKITTNVQKS